MEQKRKKHLVEDNDNKMEESYVSNVDGVENEEDQQRLGNKQFYQQMMVC